MRHFTIIFFLTVTIIAPGCGGSIDKERSGSSSSQGIDLNLIWPGGYRYDSKTSLLTIAHGKKYKSAPAYVTKITLTVFGEKEGPFDIDIAVGKLSTRLTLTSGQRRLTLKVETDLKDSANNNTFFTGELIVTITPHMTRSLTFTLAINAPPVINAINISNDNPVKHELVTITAHVTDQDPDDVITLTWAGKGSDGETETFTGASISGTADHGGVYTLTLTADDGQGGVTRKTITFFIINHPPVITEFTVTLGRIMGDINLYCNATDQDGDMLNYILEGPGGWSANGQSAVYHGSCGEFRCVVDDFDNGKTTETRIIANAAPLVTSVTSSSIYAKPNDNLTLGCTATDPENDPLTYWWPFPNVIGQNINYSFKGQGDTTIECVAEDICLGTSSGTVLINNGQDPSAATTCSNNFNSGVVRINISWNTAADLDLKVIDPGGTNTWYGYLRPGNSSELCVDMACSTVGGSVTELVYYSSVSTLSTFTIQVSYPNDCGAGTTPYNINFATTGVCGTSGYCYSALTGSTTCGTGLPYNNCTDTSKSISPGNTDTYTFTLQNP